MFDCVFFQLVTLDSMDLVVNLFVSVTRIIQCHVTMWMDAATVLPGGLGKSVHYVSTVSNNNTRSSKREAMWSSG